MAGGGSLSINRPDRLSDREVAPTGYSLILLFNVSGQDAAPTNREKQRLVGSAHPTTSTRLMVATGGRSYRSRLVSLDCYSFRKAKAGGQCPPYDSIARDLLSGSSIAFTIRSVDHSLFAQLIYSFA